MEFSEERGIQGDECQPTVSVLMITYNHERYIEKAIDGVLAQKLSYPMELVIGEDCSTDGTRDIVMTYQRKFPDVIRVIVSEKNVGVNANFSRCYEACKGKYIAICEGDDYWRDESKLERQLTFLEVNPTCVVSYHDAVVIDENDTLKRDSKLPEHLRRDFSSDELALGAFILTLTMCFRKLVPKLPEEFFRVLNADTFLISLLSQKGYGHYQKDIAPAAYREHAGGIWSSQDTSRKFVHHVTTYVWLSYYYKRCGNDRLVKQLQFRLVSKLMEEFCLSKARLILRLLREVFRGH